MKANAKLTLFLLTVIFVFNHWTQTSQGEGTVQIRSDAPGNLFVEGQEVVFSIESEAGVEYIVKDYWDNEPSSGRIDPKGKTVRLSLGTVDSGYYELRCKSNGLDKTVSFAVVADHSGKPPSADARIAVDGATAWLSKSDQWKPIAAMLRKIGIAWIRERLSWGQVEPKSGDFQWGRYDTVASALSQQGIRVYQIFHDSPGWTHPGNGRTRNPDDLRDAYRFAKTAAEHFKGRIYAWEVWNEPDISFWPDLGDRFAPLQKAVYLGLHVGNPDAPVLLSSLCRGPSPFSDNIFECGIADYFEIFNYHIYAPPEHYPRAAQRYLDLLKRFGVEDRPVWLTEAGIRLPEVNGTLSREDQERQAEFAPKSFAMSLASGTDKHFFFVLPHYLEGGIQFGSLRSDLTPYPSFTAIATAVDVLGEARYLGEYKAADKSFIAQTFHSGQGKGNVIVLWSDKGTDVSIPTKAPTLRMIDVVGREQTKRPKDGMVSVRAASSPVYVAGLSDAIKEHLSGEARPIGVLPRNTPSKVIISGGADIDNIDKDKNCYLLGADDKVAFKTDVYNFDEASPCDGKINIEAPERWKVTPSDAAFSIPPMGRRSFEFAIAPRCEGTRIYKVWVRGSSEGRKIAPSVSYFRFDVAKLKPTKQKTLNLDDPAKWQTNIAGCGEMSVKKTEGEKAGVRFDIKFPREGDRWAYPSHSFKPPADFSEYQAVSFMVRCSVDDPSTMIRFMAVEPSGSAYYTAGGVRAQKTWQRAVFLFKDLIHGGFSPADPNNKLDLDNIATMRIGCNTKGDEVRMDVREIKLVAF